MLSSVRHSSGDFDTRQLGAGQRQKAPEARLTGPGQAGLTRASTVHPLGFGTAVGRGGLGMGDALWPPEMVLDASDRASGLRGLLASRGARLSHTGGPPLLLGGEPGGGSAACRRPPCAVPSACRPGRGDSGSSGPAGVPESRLDGVRAVTRTAGSSGRFFPESPSVQLLELRSIWGRAGSPGSGVRWDGG